MAYTQLSYIRAHSWKFKLYWDIEVIDWRAPKPKLGPEGLWWYGAVWEAEGSKILREIRWQDER